MSAGTVAPASLSNLAVDLYIGDGYQTALGEAAANVWQFISNGGGLVSGAHAWWVSPHAGRTATRWCCAGACWRWLRGVANRVAEPSAPLVNGRYLWPKQWRCISIRRPACMPLVTVANPASLSASPPSPPLPRRRYWSYTKDVAQHPSNLLLAPLGIYVSADIAFVGPTLSATTPPVQAAHADTATGCLEASCTGATGSACYYTSDDDLTAGMQSLRTFAAFVPAGTDFWSTLDRVSWASGL